MNYQGITRMQAENKLLDQLERFGNVQLVVLAGFMRVLSPYFLNSFPGTIINIHPSLLPRHPGRNGLADSLGSQDEELGITIHYVDEGVDTGKIIVQESFVRDAQEPFDSLEAKIHAIEHRLYPQVVLGLLNRFDTSEALN